MNGPETSSASQSINKEGIFSIPRVLKLTYKQVEVKRTYVSHEKIYSTEVFPLRDIAAQITLMKQKTADILAQPSGAVVSSAPSLKKTRGEIQGSLVKLEGQL